MMNRFLHFPLRRRPFDFFLGGGAWKILKIDILTQTLLTILPLNAIEKPRG